MIDCKSLKEALIEYKRGKYGKIDESFFKHIGEGIRRRGFLTPIDLFCVICWKMWNFPNALDTAFESITRNYEEEKDVSKITKEAIELAEKGKIEDAVRKLTEPPTKLYGVRVKVASAILTFYDHEKYGVIDKNAWRALYGKEIEEPTPEQYSSYLQDIRKLAEKCNMKVHDIDAALYIIGKRLKQK
jgi:hypothetical protein